jgi:predicted nucleotide-binding protein
MGYFLHALGRSRVAVLHAKGVELPSNVSGVLYTSLDEMDWKTKLEQEMKAAGVL